MYGTKRVVESDKGTNYIELEGEQSTDGSVLRRLVYVSPCPESATMEGLADGPMAIEDARKFGAALIAAADEQAKLAGHEPETR